VTFQGNSEIGSHKAGGHLRKNRTEQRDSLSDRTLESLLVFKSAKLESDGFFDKKDLDRFKGAYNRHLNQ
jgi:hypothetical protein